MSPEKSSEIEIGMAQGSGPARTMSLRKNFSWTLAGNVTYAGCQWGILVVLAKLGSPEIVGQFALGLAVTAPIFMFCSLNLQTVLATEARGQYHFFHFLGLRLITTFLGLSLVIGIVLLTDYRLATKLVIFTIALAKAFESISDLIYGLLMQHERMDKVATSMMIKGPFSLLVLALAIYLTNNILWGIIGLIIVWASLLFSYDCINGISFLRISLHGQQGIMLHRSGWLETIRPYLSLNIIGRIAWLTLPLGLVLMLNSLNVNTPRYFIEHYLGEHDLGIFAAMAYIMIAGQTVVSALGVSASPRLAKHLAAGKIKDFRRLVFKLLAISIMLGAGGVLVTQVAGRQILTLLYRPEYAEHLDVFFWVMVAAGFTYMGWFMSAVSTAARYFRIQLPMAISITGTLALSCWWLIPRYGLWGAAMSIVLGMMVRALVYGAVVSHILYICSNTELWKEYYG